MLDDRGPRPRYVETVPRRGYRFIEPVATKVEEETKGEGETKIEDEKKDEGETRPARRWSRRLATYAAIALLAAMLAVIFVRTRYDKFVPDATVHGRNP